jgi:predicted NUDIX family phosphoesterase
MTMQTQTSINPFVGNQDENILVVKRTDLFPKEAFNGLEAIPHDSWIETVLTKKEFLPRSLMESDPTYKQIIPYLIFTYAGKLFLMQRQAKTSDTRLQSKFSLGIGGHIREEDIQNADIMSWAKREFHEEVDYKDSLTVEPLGILNDDSNDVGKVHVGFVYLLKGDSANIKVHEELKSGELKTLEECEEFYERMESWSKIVFDWLKSNQEILQ